ncbi:MAG: AAA family ATPase, partial [Planctomycetota bacterium]|nr:AAA family ATPase [Planctomycetota bacterium]
MSDSMTIDTLQAVAELAPQPALSSGSQQRSPSNQQNGSIRLRVADWLTDRGVTFRLKDSPTSDGRDVYLLAECPFNPEHRSPDACIMQEQSGRTSFKCLHATCVGRGWSEVKEAIGKPTQEHYDGRPERDAFQVVKSSANYRKPETGLPTGFDLKLLDSATFASTTFRRHYLVKRVLVEGQSCIIGGPKKCLKTGTLVDLAVSLGTGTPFLSNPNFVVPERVRTCVLSGESGGFTLKETAQRICAARNRLLST